jgi:predicted Rossmann fold flavoprotein
MDLSRQIMDVAVIGGGAAGLFAAGIAGQRGLTVEVLEHNRDVGAKILISGGGRCNFTNRDVRPDRFVGSNPHFARSALARYTQHDFIDLVRRHRIAFYEKTLGQLFCEGAGSARLIVRMLLDECPPQAVTVRTGVRVQDVERDADGLFRVRTDGASVTARTVIVACGGLSIPKLGATALGHAIARRFGLPVVTPRPGLVPLTFSEADLALMQPLAGVSLEAVAACGKARFREGMLFTHRGLSGPSILQVSSYRAPGGAITIDLTPDMPGGAWLTDAKRERPRTHLSTVLAEALPARLAGAWLARPGMPSGETTLADLKDSTLAGLAGSLHDWTLMPRGDEGYGKAEVTLGGVDTAALSQKTMEARAVPGLHFIGEAVDVTGWLGGYNFQWAWSSAHAAATSLVPGQAGR